VLNNLGDGYRERWLKQRLLGPVFKRRQSW
jgi:hypothetical protein